MSIIACLYYYPKKMSNFRNVSLVYMARNIHEIFPTITNNYIAAHKIRNVSLQMRTKLKL